MANVGGGLRAGRAWTTMWVGPPPMRSPLPALVLATLLTGTAAHAAGCAGRAVAQTRDPVDPDAIAEALAAHGPSTGRRYASSRAYLHYVEGMLALQDGRYAVAETELRRALLYDRDAAPIRLALAEVQWHLGRPDKADAYLAALLSETPGYGPALRLKARLAMARGDAAAAESALRALLAHDPDHRGAHEDLARLLVDQDRLDDARRLYEALARRHPADATLWMGLAVTFEARGRPAEAVAVWRRAVGADETEVRAHDGLARACEATAQRPCAIEALRAALTHGGDAAHLQLRLARLLRETGDLAGAREAEAAAVAAAPYTVQVRIDAALAAYARGDTTMALSHLEEAIRLDPADAAARFYRGLVLGDRRRWAEAARAMEAVETGSIYHLEARLHLGNALSHLGRHDDALEVLDALAESDPLDARVVTARASARLRAGDEAAAIALIEAALESAPLEPLLVEALAGLHDASGRPDEALSVLSEAAAERPEDLRLRYAHGVALERAGRVEEAVAEMKAILAKQPEHAAALNFVGYAWADRGMRLEEAEGLIRRALSLEPDNGYIVDSLGWVLYRRGRFAEAVVELERAAILLPEHPVILEHLADAYARTGRAREARETYTRALDALEADDEKRRSALLEKLGALGRAP
jgi:tetratricopeptide (TPR) repeat protein